jgi:hypothetical protein
MTDRNDPLKYSDETLLVEIFAALIRFYRKFGLRLFVVSLLFATAVALMVASRPLYSEKVILDTPDLDLQTWRETLPSLSDPSLVQAHMGPLDKSTGLDKILSRPAFWEKRVQYRTTLQREDIKETPNIDLKHSTTLGIEIALTAKSKEQGLRDAQAIAEHIRQTFLLNSLKQFLSRLDGNVIRQRSENELSIVRTAFEIEQNTRRTHDMKNLLLAYPEAKHINTIAVTSASENGGKFMPPISQLMALEATISEQNGKMVHAKRNLEKLAGYSKYLDSVKTMAEKMLSGEGLYRMLLSHTEMTFPPSSSLTSSDKEVSLELNVALTNAHTRVSLWQFKAAPVVAENPIPSRRPGLMGMVVFLLGFSLLSAIVAIANKLRKVFREDPIPPTPESAVPLIKR